MRDEITSRAGMNRTRIKNWHNSAAPELSRKKKRHFSFRARARARRRNLREVEFTGQNLQELFKRRESEEGEGGGG